MNHRSGHLRLVVDKVALGQVSSEYFGFSPNAPYSSVIRGFYNRPTYQGDSGAPNLTKFEKKKYIYIYIYGRHREWEAMQLGEMI
jgi:hypothetical protein